MKTGLCSVTFRQLPPRTIVDLTVRVQLDEIEWGGDVHVPPSAPHAELRDVGRMTHDAGIGLSSYGSYHRIMLPENGPNDFVPVLDAAEALGTDVVRIWISGRESHEADDAYFRHAADRTRAVAELAAQRSMTLAFEFHSGGLTDTAESAQRLLDLVGMPNVMTYWQPLPREQGFDYCGELRCLFGRLLHIHCFHWVEKDRRPLAEGGALWQNRLDFLAGTEFANTVLLEFTRDNAPDSFLRDAATLRDMVRRARDKTRS